MSRLATALALLMALAAAAVVVALASTVSFRRGVWFCGDFETGGFEGWIWDIARRESAVIVTQPVRKGRYAVRITLAPGDFAASKERAELKIGNKSIERIHGSQGGEMWYGWSLLVPVDYADPPGEQVPILGQWHHRPMPGVPRNQRSRVTGPPPLALYLVVHEGQHVLMLIGQSSLLGPPRRLGARPIRRGAWNDLIFHIKWSTGNDGFVAAWLNDRPFTTGKMYGPTLYEPVSNYLRLGLYRGRGGPTTDHVYYDEVRLGDSYQAVAP